MLSLVDYSAKSFAVFGETKQFKDQLKELGGKFNCNLKGQAGWIFSNLNKEKVTDFVSNKNKENVNKKETKEDKIKEELHIKKYSEKSFAIYGNTKEHKDKLKELGGKFNSNLKDGPGWIFSNNNSEKVNLWFNSLNKDVDDDYPDTFYIEDEEIDL